MSTPYGEWPSPLDAQTVAESGRGLSAVQIDGEHVYWLERRPDEGGRGVIVRQSLDGAAAESGDVTEVTPDSVDVRTLVHQYGGGDFLVDDGFVWFAALEDQRLCRLEVEAAEVEAEELDVPDPEAITPEPPADRSHRYADLTRTPDGRWLYAVRERHHEADSEPKNELVAIPSTGGEPIVVAEGHDFYGAPRVSPDGERLTYLQWDHPQMPWDGTELVVADRASDGTLEDGAVVMGGPAESVFDPQWHPSGALFAVSDRTGWWNLYVLGAEPRETDPRNCLEASMEFGVPGWVFALSTYAFLDDGRIATLVTDDGRTRLRFLEPAGDGIPGAGTTGSGIAEDDTAGDGSSPVDGREWTLGEPQLPYTAYRPASLRSDGERLAFIAGQPTEPTAVVSWTPGGEPVRHREAMTVDLEEAFVSVPESVAFPTGDAVDAEETVAHAHYYPPTNPDVEIPEDEHPPVVVTVHGGPTSRSRATLDLETQFFTTRGIAVLDVNYRGSTGYGRAYRDALQGEWGVRDTLDCVNAARYAARAGWVDPDRQAISGGSAGGYAVLAALAGYDTFDAGTSYYGVADLEALAAHTHKFESRYLDGLVGSLPEAADVYRERSPVHRADSITGALLLLQGGKDEVVPPAQAEAMIDALVDTGTPYAYLEFPEERHGFRDATNVSRALEAELAFYGEVFDFEPAGELDGVTLLEGRYPESGDST
ncbi:S9 family peptidase [Natrialbaceae archaeon A-CW1-1]